MSRRSVLLIAFLTLGLFVSVPATGGAQYQFGSPVSEDTISGAAVPIRASEEQKYLNTMDDLAASLPVETRANAFLVGSEENGLTVVLTDREPRGGLATVSGTIVDASSVPEINVNFLFADSVSFDTEGTPVSLESLLENTDDYAFELVEVSGTYTAAAFEGETGTFEKPTIIGGFGKAPVSQSPFASLASGTRWTIANLSIRGIFNAGDPWIGTYRFREGFTTNSRATLDVVVWPTALTGGINIRETRGFSLYVVNREPHASEVSSVEALQSQSEAYAGEVVTLETNVVASRTSARELVLSVLKCAPESAVMPVIGCAPIIADTNAVTGVAFGESVSGPSDILYLGGLDNAAQQSLVTQLRGRYQVTGRLVSASSYLGPSFEGYALKVIGLQRVGDLPVGSDVIETATGIASQFRERMQTRITDPDSLTTTATTRQTTTTERGTQTATTRTPTRSTTQSTTSGAVGPGPTDSEPPSGPFPEGTLWASVYGYSVTNPVIAAGSVGIISLAIFGIARLR